LPHFCKRVFMHVATLKIRYIFPTASAG
jgi:hypothetical protein